MDDTDNELNDKHTIGLKRERQLIAELEKLQNNNAELNRVLYSYSYVLCQDLGYKFNTVTAEYEKGGN